MFAGSSHCTPHCSHPSRRRPGMVAGSSYDASVEFLSQTCVGPTVSYLWPITREPSRKVSENVKFVGRNMSVICTGMCRVTNFSDHFTSFRESVADTFHQESPRQTKPKKGQFMNFSQGHSGTNVGCESCLFSPGKTPEFTKNGRNS